MQVCWLIRDSEKASNNRGSAAVAILVAMLSFSWINLRKPWWHSVGVGSSPYVVQVSHCLSCVEVHILWYGSDANENGKNFDFDSSLLASWRWEIVSANQCYCYWVFSVTVLSLSSHRNTKCKMQLAVLFEMCHTLCIVAHTNTNAYYVISLYFCLMLCEHV